MKYTISERTITVETTQPGETLSRETVQALTQREEAWEAVERLALGAPKRATWEEVQAEAAAMTPTPVDETPDPLEDLNYTDVDPSVLASEDFTPANILPAE